VPVLVWLAALAGLVAAAILVSRRFDGTVGKRMRSSSRVDGTRDPHAHTHHSSY